MLKTKHPENKVGAEVGHVTLKRAVMKGDYPRLHWECECVCGKIVTRRDDYIRKSTNLSCGCRHSNLGLIGSQNPKWCGCGEVSGGYFAAIRCGAAKREIPFDITIEQAWAAYETQGGRCAVSGLKIRFDDAAARKKTLQTASLDRIDSTKGYIAGNIQWVHKAVNQMKNHFDEDVFRMVCTAVATHKPLEPVQEVLDATKGTRNAKSGRKAA